MFNNKTDFQNFSISEIKSKWGEIKFDSPVAVDFLVFPSESRIEYLYDFGLSGVFNYYNKCISNNALIEYFKETIRGDLTFTFFLPQENKNYSLLNWALYGNLKNRAIVKHNFSDETKS